MNCRACVGQIIAFALLTLFSSPARAEKLSLSPAVQAALDKIYSGDIHGATDDAQRVQQENPEDPIGYLVEAEALSWQFWCTTAEFKYGMTFPRRRAKFASDKHYLELTAKITAIAEAQLREHESAEMHFYAGMADALAARLYGLRGEGRNTARAGVRAREHLLRALALDSDFADADFGLGLYNYYVDTLSAAARVLRFFMGIPGGSKEDGIRRLQHAIDQGVLTPTDARFYLAINLHSYDRKYERALEVITPLVEKYPSNPIYQLAQGDLLAKLGRKQQALERYRTAAASPMSDPDCHAHLQDLARLSITALGLTDADTAPH